MVICDQQSSVLFADVYNDSVFQQWIIIILIIF